MKEGICSICLNNLDKDEADILTMGIYGTPRYICPDCAADLTKATTSRDVKEIEEAMDKIGQKLAYCGIDDERTRDTIEEIFNDAKARALEIKNGTYDFSLDDEPKEDVLEEIPEDMQESEEDKLLDKKESEKLKKFEDIINWITIGLGAAAAIFFVVYFLIL